MKANKTRAILFIAALVLLFIGIRVGGFGEIFQPEEIRRWVKQWGPWGPIFYMAVFAITPALFLPGLPMTIAGGLAFGPLWGTVYASIGSTLGAALAFLVARYFARDAVGEMLGERGTRIDEGVARQGWVFVAVTRLIPLFPFFLLNYAFGLTRISFGTYVVTSWIFMLPGTAAYVVFSSSLIDLLRGELSVTLLIGLLLLLLVSSIPLAYRKWKGIERSQQG